MRRTSIQVALLFLAGAVGVAVGCANGDSTGSSGSGGSNGSGTGGSSATGGTPGTGGATTSTGGTPGTGGETTSTGGTPGTGGATSTGTGGAGGSGTFGQPVCGNTGANVAIAKSVACTSTDTQLCYKTCGPSGASGVKSETCTNSAYVEMPGCSFPPGVDYSCYKIPTTVSSMCPTTAPQANMPCTVPTCTPCNVGGNYLDSTAASKTGWCVCTTSGKWTCATTGTNSSWPCPGNTGC